jgi:hypothetical protein
MSFGTVASTVVPATAENWKRHDGGASWSDGGQVDTALKPAADALRKIIGDHVRDAVLEYASTVEYGLVVVSGQPVITARYWNADAEFVTTVPLRGLLGAALKDAYSKAADPKAMELMTAVAGLAKDLTIASNRKQGAGA